MTTTQTEKITYRRTKTGEWVAYGAYAPIAELVAAKTAAYGQYADGALAAGAVSIEVTTKAGATKWETIVRLGQPFTVDGVEMVYAYLRPQPRRYVDSSSNDYRRGFGR